MDKLIRIVIMIIVGLFLPYIANIIYKPFRDTDAIQEMNIVEKILWGLFYVFIMNWLIVAPAMIFSECFKYILNN